MGSKRNFKWLVLSIAVFWSARPDISLANSCGTQSLNKLFHAGGKKDNPIEFSYQIAIDPQSAPKLVDYYKVNGQTDEAWFRKSLDERFRLLRESTEGNKISDGSAGLVKTEKAPEFLAEKVVRDGRSSVKVSGNAATLSINETSEQLKWFFENIGAGSVEGRVAFKRSGSGLTANSAHFLKQESDTAQLEYLKKIYERYFKAVQISS